MVVIVVVVVTAWSWSWSCVVSLAEHEVTVDRIARRVDDLDVLEQPVERLGLAHLGDEIVDGVVLLVGLADLVGLLANLHRDAGVLGVEVVVGDLEALGESRRRAARGRP